MKSIFRASFADPFDLSDFLFKTVINLLDYSYLDLVLIKSGHDDVKARIRKTSELAKLLVELDPDSLSVNVHCQIGDHSSDLKYFVSSFRVPEEQDHLVFGDFHYHVFMNYD